MAKTKTKAKAATRSRKALNRSANGTTAPAPQKGAASQPTAKNDKMAEAFARWKDGAQIHELAKETGTKRSKLRRSFIALAGGKEAFRALRAAGAGGQAEPFGGKRATGGRTKEVIAIDDSKTFTLTRAEMKDTGWSSATIRTPFGSTAILIAPDGTQYGKASATEKAELIYQHGVVGIAPSRLKQLKGSALAKTLSKAEKEAERGEAALERTTTRKRAARKARKSRA